MPRWVSESSLLDFLTLVAAMALLAVLLPGARSWKFPRLSP
jgi:hypothetical protein